MWKLKCTHRISRRKERRFLLDERIGLSAERIGENYMVSILHRISKVKKIQEGRQLNRPKQVS